MKNNKTLTDELDAKQIQLELQNEELRRIAHESDELKNRYYELYDFAPVGYVKTDDKGLILEINITGAMILGTDRSHILKIPLITFIAVPHRAEFSKFLYQMQVTESRVHTELKLRDRKNNKKYVHLEGTVNKDEHPWSFMIAIIDITERKKAEEDLQNAYRGMEQRVEERTVELTKANQLLKDEIMQRKQTEEELGKAKEQAELYLDLMSHDINNLNHSAMGYLELALDTLNVKMMLRLDDKMLIERPMQSLADSSVLINNVQKIQKLRTEGIKAKPTDLDKIFRALEETSFHSKDRDVTINIQRVPGVIVEANELLKDVFVNLIANAIKHSDEEKPLTVNVKVKPVNENGRSFFQCMVEDNGPGIPDEMKSKLFKRLQRGATKAQGKGLGLYLVRMLVEGYHGSVWVEDREPGDHTKGTRFVVMLPAVEVS